MSRQSWLGSTVGRHGGSPVALPCLPSAPLLPGKPGVRSLLPSEPGAELQPRLQRKRPKKFQREARWAGSQLFIPMEETLEHQQPWIPGARPAKPVGGAVNQEGSCRLEASAFISTSSAWCPSSPSSCTCLRLRGSSAQQRWPVCLQPNPLSSTAPPAAAAGAIC